MFNIGAIGFDVDGNELIEFELVKLFDLPREDLQASMTYWDVWGATVIVGAGGISVDVDGYENVECSDVVAWLPIIGVSGGTGGFTLTVGYKGGGRAVFVKSNVITGGVSDCVNGVLYAFCISLKQAGAESSLVNFGGRTSMLISFWILGVNWITELTVLAGFTEFSVISV